MWPEILPTIIICALLVGAVVIAIISIIRDKRKGKSCSCGCSSCAMRDTCHTSNDKNNTPDTKIEDEDN